MSSDSLHFDHELDVRGHACPLPIIKTRKFVNGLSAGEILKVMTSDAGSASDFRALAHATGLELLAQHESNGELQYFLRKP